MGHTKTRLLKISNKALSGALLLLGFGSLKDHNEMGEIVPMYGMPAATYQHKSKAREKLSLPQEVIEMEQIIHHFLLKKKQHVY